MKSNIILGETKKYPYAEANKIALEVLEQLRPHCIRIEIAGSLRRKKPMVKDIDIVLIPKPYQTGSLEDGIASVVNRWQKVKGEMQFGKTKATQRILPSGINLDIYFADESNWGSIFGIRTGSANFSRYVLASGWVKKGFKSEGGHLFKDGVKHEIKEEADLFRIIGIPYVEPEQRN